MADELELGDEVTMMPGSTFRRTWEVTGIDDETVTLTLLSKAVGYVTEEVTDTFPREKFAANVDDGVFTGEVVKTMPDMETAIVD